MKTVTYYLFSIGFLVTTFGFSQETPSSEQALKQYEAISKTMAISFPEDDMKTYSRESFSQKALEKYLLRHFQRMDLLPYIEGHHALKLNSFLHSGNWFKQIGLPKESINYYKQFFDYHKKFRMGTNEKRLKSMLKILVSSEFIIANKD